MERQLTSREVSNVWQYITEFKPSDLIPFKGNFPLLPPFEKKAFGEDIESHVYVDECSDKTQTILAKGERIRSIHEGFFEYLQNNGIIERYRTMKSADKATELVRFFEANSLTMDCLKIN